VALVDADVGTLTLHAARLLGFGDVRNVAHRFEQDCRRVQERLLDREAIGWVSRSEFGGAGGWSLTERGRAEGERLLAEALDAVGARATVAAVQGRLLPQNARF
jgi:hypothetical protein